MIALRPHAARLAKEERGSAVIEFALIGPFLILALLAVFQIALQTQNYNAVRNLAADGSRFAVVQYQQGTRSPPDAIATWVRAKAIGSAYNLETDRLTVTVTNAATSRLAGMTEMTIAVSYSAPDYLWTIAGDSLNISYTKPVFLPD